MVVYHLHPTCATVKMIIHIEKHSHETLYILLPVLQCYFILIFCIQELPEDFCLAMRNNILAHYGSNELGSQLWEGAGGAYGHMRARLPGQW